MAITEVGKGFEVTLSETSSLVDIVSAYLNLLELSDNDIDGISPYKLISAVEMFMLNPSLLGVIEGEDVSSLSSLHIEGGFVGRHFSFLTCGLIPEYQLWFVFHHPKYEDRYHPREIVGIAISVDPGLVMISDDDPTRTEYSDIILYEKTMKEGLTLSYSVENYPKEINCRRTQVRVNSGVMGFYSFFYL